MIIWLASYPKSGNTFVRALLTSYFFCNDGILDFKLMNSISVFPNELIFKKFGVDIYNEREVLKNYLRIQKLINKQNSIQFIKTHSSLFNIEGRYPFTNLDTSLGVIYIVRDPRNVITSYAHHLSVSPKETKDIMIKNHKTSSGNNNSVFTYVGSWGHNFMSWQSFKFQQRYLLIKYEDLAKDTEKTFLSILNFVNKCNKTNFSLDKLKLKNSLDSCSFETMSKLEDKKGFPEAIEGKKFFHLGKKNNWKELLDLKLKEELEKNFEKEMTELGYL